MFKTAFLQKNVNNLKSYRRFFPNYRKQASELSSFIPASLKSVATIQLAAQNAGQI